MSHPAHAAPTAADATRKLLASLWQKNLPMLRERLALLEAAAQAAEAGTLTEEQRHEAGSTAHKLAGSLGTFGYPRGTELARALEHRFDSDQPLKGAGLAGQVISLRSELAV